MKKFLKILLIIAAPLLLIAGFCGYHFYRMVSLDSGVYLSGDGSGALESALNMLLFSKVRRELFAVHCRVNWGLIILTRKRIWKLALQRNFFSESTIDQENALDMNCRNDTKRIPWMGNFVQSGAREL